MDTYTNKVSIEGEVLRPGSFELTAGMSLADLFAKAKGITPEAFVSRGLILRTNADASQEQIPFDITKTLEGAQQIALQNKDVVTVFNKESLREKELYK